MNAPFHQLTYVDTLLDIELYKNVKEKCNLSVFAKIPTILLNAILLVKTILGCAIVNVNESKGYIMNNFQNVKGAVKNSKLFVVISNELFKLILKPLFPHRIRRSRWYCGKYI